MHNIIVFYNTYWDFLYYCNIWISMLSAIITYFYILHCSQINLLCISSNKQFFIYREIIKILFCSCLSVSPRRKMSYFAALLCFQNEWQTLLWSAGHNMLHDFDTYHDKSQHWCIVNVTVIKKIPICIVKYYDIMHCILV